MLSCAALFAGAASACLGWFPFGASDSATAEASPTVVAVAAVPTAGVAAPTVGTPCEHHGWPYVDRRCVERARGERLRQVRVIKLDRVAPATIVTPVATIDPALRRSADAAARTAGAVAAPLAAKPAAAAQGHEPRRVKVIAQTVPSEPRSAEQPARPSRAKPAPVTASLHVPPPSPAASAPEPRGGSFGALAYGETPRTNGVFPASFGRTDSQFR
jgi:hypothetical protein